MVIVTVMANSRNSRPTMPPISSSGMKTATSDRLIDTMVKPISPAPRSAAWNGCDAFLDVAVDVLDHDDGVIDHEADRDGQRHQRQVVQAVAAAHTSAPTVAASESGTVMAGITVAADVPQEQEDHHHDQADRQDQRELHVVDGGPDRLGPVGHDLDMDRRRDRCRQPRAAPP